MQIDDLVACTRDHYKDMVTARVIGFTAKKIRLVQTLRNGNLPVAATDIISFLKDPYTVAKLNA